MMIDRTLRHKKQKRIKLKTYVKLMLSSAVCTVSITFMNVAYAETESAATTETETTSCPTRPKVLTNRWQENWDVLKQDCVPRKRGDQFKYIPFGHNNYLSLGANLRERIEINDRAKLGSGNTPKDGYLIQRLQIHADARIGEHLQVFTQLIDSRAFDKKNITPTDQNRFDVEQAFIAWVSPLRNGTFKFRIGRQEMAFDLQRFISNREGPNVRQPFDGIWSAYEFGDWRVLGYLTRPVQIDKYGYFNDFSNSNLSFSGFRVDKQNILGGELSGYYSRYQRDHGVFPNAAGHETRDLYDVRHLGKKNNIDWDIEAMLQYGDIGSKSISAWAGSGIAGYTFSDHVLKPRIALQLDAASGDRNPEDGELNTFNQLFANGSYFTLAGYTGYSNLIHVKPSITIKPTDQLTLMGALGLQWRETTRDAVYFQGNNSMNNTAGHGSKWTGSYIQLRADQKFNDNLSLAAEMVHFNVSDSIQKMGGDDSQYVGLELKYGW